MDFFARQESARRQSRWLVIAYAITVLCVIFGIDTIAVIALAAAADDPQERLAAGSVFGWCTVLVGALIAGATLYKTVLLRGGGSVVARDLGGVRVDSSSADPARRRLVNVVEEMAIASGVPAPEVYVLENETAINALSAGHSPANAAIAVTAGMLKRLNRDQLQAVVAHEFSHILNGDMRLSIRLMGLNFGLLVVAMAGRLMLQGSGGRSSRKGKGGALILVALAIMVIGYLGQVGGRLLQAMISRRREQLADASAVQFTRNPDGLKGALLRAAAQKTSTRLQSTEAEEVAHMLFLASGRRLFVTHPPVIERLRELETGYAEQRMRDEITALQLAWDNEPMDDAAFKDHTPKPGALAGGLQIGPGGGLVGVLSSVAVAASIADPQPEHVQRARAIREALPQRLQELAGAPEKARAFVLALLLTDETETRERQLALLRADPDGAALAAAVEAAGETAALLSPAQRLPAVLQLFPALRQLPAADQRGLIAGIARLSAADRRIDVFEFALGRLVACSLEELLRPRAPHGTRSLDTLLPGIATLFSVIARHGADNETDARRAYAAGMSKLLGSRWPDYDCPWVWAPPLSEALDEMRELQPAGKELLIEGLVATIGFDGQVTVAESELLRAVCAVLQCPLPPLIPAGSPA